MGKWWKRSGWLSRIALVVGVLVLALGAVLAFSPSPQTLLTSLAMLAPALGAAISGRGGKVMYGAVTLANIDTWSLSGFQMDTAETTSFGDTVKTYIPSGGGAGTISFSGNYDPADTTGQAAVATACRAGNVMTNLYLYVNTSTFWRVGTGGNIIITKCDAPTMPRSGKGTISFEGIVSGAAMECVGTGS